MPKQKDLKRVVRTRMQKTGESYTTARMHVLKQKKSDDVDYATRAGMSDEKVKQATGCDWATWVAALDYAHADEMSHREIAKYIREKFHTPNWWAQTVTVGYERIRGVRAIGQRVDGSYEATKSKTVGVPVEKLYRAFRDPRLRARWLPGVNLTVRTATPNKSMRVQWDDSTRVEIGFVPKGEAESQVSLAHVRLQSKAEAERMKAYWAERLEAMAEMVTK